MLDTHAAVKRLQAAGMDERQAEAIVDTLHAALTARLDTLAHTSPPAIAPSQLRLVE